MKKKILFGSILLTIAVALTFNVTIANKGSNSGVSLHSLSFCFQAQAENGETSTQCNGSECNMANGNYYKTKTNDDGTRICCGVVTETDRGCMAS